MGREARCMAEFGGWQGMGKLLLETDELVFRGAARLSLRLTEIARVDAVDGWLEIEHAGGSARFDLANAAEKWARAIAHPRSRIDKLDVRTDSRVALVDLDDPAFLAELCGRTARIEDAADARELDLVFYRCDEPGGLTRLAELRAHIAQNGAVWVITPKGRPALGHDAIIGAAKAAGLVDTKTARFSDTHTALKLVIPRGARAAVQTAGRRASSQK